MVKTNVVFHSEVRLEAVGDKRGPFVSVPGQERVYSRLGSLWHGLPNRATSWTLMTVDFRQRQEPEPSLSCAAPSVVFAMADVRLVGHAVGEQHGAIFCCRIARKTQLLPNN